MPDNSQNFNIFCYCLNNPLIYTDPSGDFIITAVLVGVAVGVAVDYGVKVASNYLSGDRAAAAWFNNVDFFAVAVSGAIGGLTAGYGSAFSNGAKLGKFGMGIVNNSALIRLAELGLTSAIDITGNGWQDISFKDFGTRAIVAGLTYGISNAMMPKRLKHSCRSLNASDAESLKLGKGLVAKAPEGSWSLEDHLIRGSSKKARLNSPWISTSSDINIAKSFSSNNGLVRISLSKLPSNNIYRAWTFLPRSSAGYHFSIWQQEFSIFKHIPNKAIKLLK